MAIVRGLWYNLLKGDLEPIKENWWGELLIKLRIKERRYSGGLKEHFFRVL